ncbi:MAG: Flp pilus assembly complex ATPase component TadA [Clostridiales bacterium]|nr:Flp pilus assembly complex ATPase component TadA [Clostridiales bacterium]
MNWQETMGFFANCMPKSVGKTLLHMSEGTVREIRVRSGGNVRILTDRGEIATAYSPNSQQVAQMAEALCENALYARAEEQRQGYVTLRGGHRMGLCGRVIAQGQSVRALREISSFCVRIAGQWYGAADQIIPHLVDERGRVKSTLIMGLPGMGKTTMLRDACRSLSESGLRMCVVDERSEIAAMCAGMPQLDIGPNTDVLDGCGKETGLRWMLRAMSPDALVTDELGGVGDAQAVLEATRSGISVLATLHGRDLEQAVSRGALYHLVQNRSFACYVVLDEAEVGKVAGIYDEQLRLISVGGNA